MNKQEADILMEIQQEQFATQRMLSEATKYSLGIVNKSLHNLKNQGYINEDNKLTDKARKDLNNKSPQNAIILAAGLGMRMVPINMQIPKALIEVKGEILIERIIKHLHETGITEIYVVVGFMKEEFEYLIDEYGVKLIVNDEYSHKNNLHSLYLAASHLKNTYIVPCDIWCEKNPFNKYELYSWYMVSDRMDKNSDVRVNRKWELVRSEGEETGNRMIGITYLLEEQSKIVQKQLERFDKISSYNESFWEIALYESNRMVVQARVVNAKRYVEINTYEQLRELDEDSNTLNTDIMNIIVQALDVKITNITDIIVLKKGMTNRSFLFRCGGRKYIMRIPGEGTDKLINRREEAEVYEVLRGRGICDDIAYINAQNGYKITEFLEGARVCNADSEEDIKVCMKKLREFHDQKLIVGHEFDIFKQIEFY